MSFRWADEAPVIVLSCLVEALWVGTVAALVGRHGLLVAVCVTGVLMMIGAASAVLARDDRRSLRLPRAMALAALFATIAVAVVAVPGHTQRASVTVALEGLVYGVAVIWLGTIVGRRPPQAEELPRRVLRSFVLVFCALLAAAIAGEHVVGSGALVTVTVLAIVALLAIGRLTSVRAALARGQGRKAVWWLLGVVLVAGVVLLVSAGVVGAVSLHTLLWPFALVWRALTHVREAAAWVLYRILSVVFRAIAALFRVLHIHRHALPSPRPRPVPTGTANPVNGGHARRLPRFVGVIGEIVVAVMLVAAATELVARMVRRSAARCTEEFEEEQRESLVSARGVAGEAARRALALARRLAPRRPLPARTPADAVRREYRSLEAALAARGRRRLPTTTVRRFLGELPEAGGALPAARLSALYERARYARGLVVEEDAGVFHAAAAELLAALDAGVPS